MRQQRRPWADLDEDAGALAGRFLDSLAEAHRLADVAPPIAGVELPALQHGPGHGGDHGNRAGMRLQSCEIAQQRLLGRVHQPAVEGVGEVELATTAALARQRLHGRVDIGDRARHGDGLRAVIGGDVEASDNPRGRSRSPPRVPAAPPWCRGRASSPDAGCGRR